MFPWCILVTLVSTNSLPQCYWISHNICSLIYLSPLLRPPECSFYFKETSVLPSAKICCLWFFLARGFCSPSCSLHIPFSGQTQPCPRVHGLVSRSTFVQVTSCPTSPLPSLLLTGKHFLHTLPKTFFSSFQYLLKRSPSERSSLAPHSNVDPY